MTAFDTFSRDSRVGRGRNAAGVIGGAVATIVTQLRMWKNRQSVARLLEWDAHMRGDIGLTEGDVYAAMASRVDEDASSRLAMLSMERRSAHRAQARDRLNHAAELGGGSATYRRKA